MKLSVIINIKSSNVLQLRQFHNSIIANCDKLSLKVIHDEISRQGSSNNHKLIQDQKVKSIPDKVFEVVRKSVMIFIECVVTLTKLMFVAILYGFIGAMLVETFGDDYILVILLVGIFIISCTAVSMI